MRRGAWWRCALASLCCAWSASAFAESVIFDDHATFRWTHSVGPYNGYEVFVARNGGPLQLSGVSALPEWTATGEPNDRIEVAVRAYGTPFGPSGPRLTGPLSERSEPVRLLADSAASTGVLTLENRALGRLELRALDSSGTASTLTSLQLPGNTWELLQLGGLTGSRRPEVLLRDSGTGAIWLGELSPDGVRERSLLWGVGLISTRTLLGDFDADGMPELAMRYPQTEVVVIWKLAADRFTPVATLPCPAGASFVSTRDYNGDGRSDLWFETSDGRVSVYPIPQLRIDSHVAIPGPLVGYDVAGVADYDGDGRLDLLWRNASGALVIELLRGMAGAPGFQLLPLSALGVNAARAVRSSADHDGVAGAEIYVQNTQTGAVDVVYPRTLLARSQRLLDPGLDWRLVQTGY
jgi:hypothetical protein